MLVGQYGAGLGAWGGRRHLLPAPSSFFGVQRTCYTKRLHFVFDIVVLGGILAETGPGLLANLHPLYDMDPGLCVHGSKDVYLAVVQL